MSVAGVRIAPWQAPLTDPLLDPSSHEYAFDWDAVEAEFTQREMWAKTAKLYDLIHRAMTRGLRFPEIFVNTRSMAPRDIEDFARRAAALDLASRLRASENTVLERWRAATVLKERLPRFWTHFVDGEVSESQVRHAVRAAENIPEQAWAALDEGLCAARNLTNPKFRAKARALREKLHPEPLAERHEQAMARREIQVEVEEDGMSWLGLYTSSEQIALAKEHIEKLARDLSTTDGETRTLEQLRADVAADLLTGELVGSGSGVALALTVPVLTLLGQSDELPTLEGVGPIDLPTAKRLAGGQKSFIRVLTDPIEGTVLDIDQTKYKAPKSMRRFLQVRDQTCTAPGCNRRAVYCDLDHVQAFSAGGKTAVKNLAHLCRHHHRIKHHTKWRVIQQPDGTVHWISPTGHTALPDKPPF